MGKVIADISMSLDGFIAASHRTPEEPMGRGGEKLHEWAFGEDESSRELMAESGAKLGALIAGRRTYDDSVRFWGADGPMGPARRPVFVVTHQAPADSPADGVYTFVTDGIESALEQARAAAGEQDVAVMGGADLIQRFLAAGLVDEIGIHLAPVLFGSGLRLFGDLGEGHVALEPIEVVDTRVAVHMRYRIRR
ncbi:dihydrofolate reductase family protein [Streptomonospora algeriensis]|uniref:Dihydrofolate reductase family protein n=1 Tax=Streptomonospora algeriensis TaxID=995084 RepID=A0ABW3BK73_9ACTN